jgi:heme-degrading monooxygenase HmoA
MFARVTRIQGTPDNAERLGNWRVPHEALAAPGLKGSYILFDRKNSRMMTMSLWESEKAMVDSAEQASQIRKQAHIDVGAVGTAVVEMYEVVAQP